MVKDSTFPHANATHFPEKAKNYMLILEDKSELTRNILQVHQLPSWNPLAKAVVYYQLRAGEVGENVAIDFINELRTYKLLKSIVLIHDDLEDEVISYSWRPYTDKNCGDECNSVYILDICQDENFVEVEQLRNTIPIDLKGCPLIVHAIVAEPYVMSPSRKISKEADIYEFDKGGEVNLVKTIAEFTNMSLYIFMSEQEENWGTINRNGTATGTYGLLRNDSIDLMIGNIEVTRRLRKWFSPTKSYTQDEMTWCVPRAKEAATWDNLLIIFQWPTWVAMFFGCIIMGTLFHIFYCNENLKPVSIVRSILVTFNMLLGWTVSFKPKSTTFRILVFSWLFFSMNMTISYESLLRSFLMHPRFEKQISTESELIRSGISFGGREIYRTYFEMNNSTAPHLFSNYEGTTFSEGVRRTAFDQDFAVVASRRQAEYQDQNLGKGTSYIYCFPESDNLYKYSVVLLARKWFPILDRFNSIIRSVIENGLIEKWNRELFIHRPSVERVGTILPLSIQHLLGAFAFILIMYALTILVFVGELVMGYIEKRKLAVKAVYPFKI
ncbi:hypothetical protein RR46_08737 [Papilio xuthus]|uniref:Ionotropic glutamate receptor C-terminal domain-containing protein n=1 Tax=Papilio xuthus TaxID=66420 RepID=A0A194PQN6_PAPXU|nr:hypothetical protein RR46_08737 [Papilio xuthus]